MSEKTLLQSLGARKGDPLGFGGLAPHPMLGGVGRWESKTLRNYGKALRALAKLPGLPPFKANTELMVERYPLRADKEKPLSLRK